MCALSLILGRVESKLPTNPHGGQFYLSYKTWMRLVDTVSEVSCI